MSAAAIGPLQAESDRVRDLVGTLTADEWAALSGCTGWRVQDVVVHMACVFHQLADPASIEGGTSPDAEANAEIPVQARRALTSEQAATEYETWAPAGIEAMRAMQDPAVGETVVPLGNLGAHPMHLLANALVFDHYCHLRHDIGSAVERAADLPRDGDVMAAVLEWMMAGVAQMCAPALAECPSGLNLALTGAGGGTWALVPPPDPHSRAAAHADSQPPWTVRPGAEPSLPTVSGAAHDFVSWGTKRADWRQAGLAFDDQSSIESLAPTLDALNVI